MRKKVAELWVKELRSGNWKQGKMFLEHSNQMCIMGLLSNIAGTFGICEKTLGIHSGKVAFFDKNVFNLPQSVVKWSGMKSQDGFCPGLKYSLVEMNDKGKNFSELADIIENNWEKL